MVANSSAKIWKTARRLGGHLYRTRIRRDIPILTFHRIRQGDGIAVETLDRVLDHVASEFRTITLTELASLLKQGGRLPRNHIVLTFDDATLDHYHTVAPALNCRGLRASFGVIGCTLVERTAPPLYAYFHVLDTTALRTAQFGFPPLVPDQLLRLDQPARQRLAAASSPLRQAVQGSEHSLASELVAALAERLEVELPAADKLFMNLEQIRELVATGHEAAAHSLRHQDVGEPSLPRWEEDLKTNFTLMSDVFGSETPPAYIYPFGKERRPHIHSKIKQAGFCCACTSRRGTNVSKCDPFSLSRVGVCDEASVPFDVIY